MKTSDPVKWLAIVSVLFFSIDVNALILAKAAENPLFTVSVNHGSPVESEHNSIPLAQGHNAQPTPIETPTNTQPILKVTQPASQVSGAAAEWNNNPNAPKQQWNDNTGAADDQPVHFSKSDSNSLPPVDSATNNTMDASTNNPQNTHSSSLNNMNDQQPISDSSAVADLPANNTMPAVQSATSTPVTSIPATSTPDTEKNTHIEVSDHTSKTSSITQHSDSEIVNNIQRSMATNNDVSDANIDIACKEGVVSLSGKINNYIESNALIVIAESTPGVKDVDVANLTLKNKTHLAKDAVISAKIRGTLIREGLFFNNKLNPVKVVTFNGSVTLMGAVENEDQLQQAMDLAKSISGVSKVKSHISIGNVNKLSRNFNW